MTWLILKTAPALFSWGILIYVILSVPYPESLTQASSSQLLSFFIPLFLTLIFSINILLRNILSSIFISFGVIILLILKALDSLNLVSAGLTIIAIILLVSYFRRNSPPSTNRSGSGDLTSGSIIPKLKHLRRKK